MTQSRFRQAESMSATSAQHLHGQRPQTTDGAGAARQRLRRTAASVLAFLAFCLLMISLQPFDFASEFESGDTEGDRINQIGFLIAGVAMALGLVTLVDRRLLQIFLAQFPKCMHGLLIAAARQARGDALPTMPMRWNHRR